MKKKTGENRRFEPNLAEAEAILKTIRHGEADAMIRKDNVLALRLREAERALRLSEQFHRSFMQRNPDALFCVDVSGMFTQVNPAACRLSGYTTEELLGKKWQDICSPRHIDNAMQAFKSALAGQFTDFEVDMIRKDGRTVNMRLSGGPAMVENGKPQILFVVAHDLTARKSAEAALQRAHQLSEALNRINLELHSMVDFNKVVRTVVSEGVAALNSDTGAITLRDAGEWVVTHVHGMPGNIVGSRLSDEQELHTLLAMRSGRPVPVCDAFEDDRFNREHFRRHNIRAVLVAPLIIRGETLGAIFFNYHAAVHAFTECEINFAGQLAATAAIALDNARLLSERKEAQETLHRMNLTLENKVERRTAELSAAIEQMKQQDYELKSRAELLDLAHDTIIVHDLDGRITFWNKGAENTYGWKQGEVAGKISHQVLKTEFCEPLLRIISTISRKGKWEGELIHMAKDGTRIVVQSRWVLRKAEKQIPSEEILVIERDITAMKTAQQESRRAREYAESIIETIEDCLVVLDSELKVLSANKSFYESFGLERSQTEGEYIYRLGRNQWDIPDLRKLLEDILPRNTAVEDYEMEYKPPKGGSRTLLLNARRIYKDREKTQMVLLAMRDVTVFKRQEKQIRQLTEDLLLAEEKQRQNVAMALHDSMGQLLAFSKRELALLVKEPALRTDTRLKRILNEIRTSFTQCRQLTADLSSPTLKTFGLHAALEELAEQFSQDNGLRCSFNGPADPGRLESKIELLLYRSVKELLCNIAKHARADNVTIDLNASGGFLEITVSDDGKGFNASKLGKRTTRKRSFGLFSIQQRLANIGGKFHIQSTRKKGTRVTLQTPVNAAYS